MKVKSKIFLGLWMLGLSACVQGQTSDEVASQVLSQCKLAKPIRISTATLLSDGYRFTRVMPDHRPDLAGYQNELSLSEQDISLNLFNLKSGGVASGILGARMQALGDDTQIGFQNDDEGSFDFESSAEVITGGIHYLTSYLAGNVANAESSTTTFEMIVQNEQITSVLFSYPGAHGPDKICVQSMSL